MYVKCNYPTININGKEYKNRPVNMDNIITFDESTTTFNNVNVPSIKFTTIIMNDKRPEIIQWIFDDVNKRNFTLTSLYSMCKI
jgi:hypothetical protein